MGKSQVTVFIMVGILILVIFGFMYYLISSIEVDNEHFSSERYMKQCVERKGKHIFNKFGLTGGRFINDTYNSSYLLRSGNIYVPSLSEVNQRIKKEFNKSIQECINSYDGYEELEFYKAGYDISHTQKEVFITIKEPYKIKGGKKVSYVGSLPLEFDIRIKKILELVNQTLIEYNSTGFIMERHLLTEDGVRVYVMQNSRDLLWLVHDENSLEYRRPYTFRFITQR
ncbi:MAG: hypothetical protein ACOCZ6_03135 [Nanoarchaeota archaeon]